MMTLDGTTKWMIVFLVCAAGIILVSWSRFDEPSYDSQSEYFARYKPRFSTSYKRYIRARLAYIGAILSIYAVFSLVPELFTTFAYLGTNVEPPKTIDGLFPLVVTVGLLTFNNVAGLKELERRIRGSLHAVARIPDCVRRTVAQMRSSPFTFDRADYDLQTKKLDLPAEMKAQLPDNLAKLTEEDPILHTWYSVGCVLRALSERKRDSSGIDPIFFANYKEELDNITAKHAALAGLVREHLIECLRGNNPADLGTLGEVRDLRDRLYTFVACGVHSSVMYESDSRDVVAKLGFAMPDDAKSTSVSIIGPLIGLSFIFLTFLSIFTGYSAKAFSEYLLPRVGAWISALRVPTETLGFFAWSWTTAMFYCATILGALAVRNSKINRREWFDINNLHRERPLLRYVMPVVMGTVCGFITLSIIAVIGGPGFKASFGEVGVAVVETIPWFPLATVMAFIVVVLSDDQLMDERFWRRIVIHGVAGALIMSVVGFLTSQLSVKVSLDAFSKRELVLPTDAVLEAGFYTSIFIAIQIGLLVFVLCVIAQIAEGYVSRTRSLAGKCIDFITPEGEKFSIVLNKTGEAVLSVRTRESPEGRTVRCRGEWQLFPEGTALRWTSAPGNDSCKVGSFGLIRRSGEEINYEAYTGQFSAKRKPLFGVRVDIREDASRPAERIGGTDPTQELPVAVRPQQPSRGRVTAAEPVTEGV